jgi:hypothetical protein
VVVAADSMYGCRKVRSDLGVQVLGSYRRLNAACRSVWIEGEWDIAHLNRQITNTTRETRKWEMRRGRRSR